MREASLVAGVGIAGVGVASAATGGADATGLAGGAVLAWLLAAGRTAGLAGLVSLAGVEMGVAPVAAGAGLL